MTSDEPTFDEVSSACAELIGLWHTRGEIQPDKSVVGYHDARLHAVSGLSAHTYYCGEVASRLISEKLALASAPLVRLAYECAISAMWVAQVPDGAVALLNEDYRTRRLTAETMTAAGLWAAAGLTPPEQTDVPYDSISDAQARNFRRMCDDLVPGGDEIYSYYRTLCWFSHATNYVLDHYSDLSQPDGQPAQLTLRRRPKSDPEITYLLQFFAAAALVLAASALNSFDAEKAHQCRIDELANRLGVEWRVGLSETARARLSPDNDAG